MEYGTSTDTPEVIETPRDGVLEVKMEGETCPYCGTLIPSGLVAEHMMNCPKRPQEKIVEKVVEKDIVKEIVTEVPKYIPGRPSRPRDVWVTKPWTGETYGDVRVRRSKYPSCSGGHSEPGRAW